MHITLLICKCKKDNPEYIGNGDLNVIHNSNLRSSKPTSNCAHFLSGIKSCTVLKAIANYWTLLLPSKSHTAEKDGCNCNVLRYSGDLICLFSFKTLITSVCDVVWSKRFVGFLMFKEILNFHLQSLQSFIDIRNLKLFLPWTVVQIIQCADHVSNFSPTKPR